MDNLTHSLTGVVAARVFPTAGGGPEPPGTSPGGPEGKGPKPGRLIFWLMLVSVNLPDVDVIANFFTDPLRALHYHRGFTHSYLMAPLIALLPAAAAWFIDRRARFGWLWAAAAAGIVLHISVDLITPYGTQIFFPLSASRYSLDWMFIIDPWFTGALALLLIAGKVAAKYRRQLGFATIGFVCLYLGAESLMHYRALGMFTARLKDSGTAATAVSVLPQPLGITEWVGLARTPDGPVRQYLRLSGEGDWAAPELFPAPTDRYTRLAMETPYVRRYLEFARFPAVTSAESGGVHGVEFRDLQFSVDPGISAAVGLGERDLPFVLRLEYGPADSLLAVWFNGRPVPLLEGVPGKP